MNFKVNFLCVGAQKSGTTTLRAYLREHPTLNVPDSEIHYFDNESNRFEDCETIDRYHSNFRSIASGFQQVDGIKNTNHGTFLSGEVTPIYVYWRPSLLRIYCYNPEIKLIFILRNPMARAYSQWSMEYARGAEMLSFSEAIRMENVRCAAAHPLQHRVYSYIDRGYYYRQLIRFIDVFPSENLLFLSAELFYSEPGTVLRQISEFLGVPGFQVKQRHHHRRGSYGHGLTLYDWHYIYDRLSADISDLGSILPWDISSWHSPWSGLE